MVDYDIVLLETVKLESGKIEGGRARALYPFNNLLMLNDLFPTGNNSNGFLFSSLGRG
jgi:hypothetical protein